MNTELAAKRLGMLHELLPKAARFAVQMKGQAAMAAFAKSWRRE
jgi:hypothetical protein